ncbi:MAG TPA: response regulator [Polyangiaceae bacterium]|nr:response regulator [Polyangiaceae bacterium]
MTDILVIDDDYAYGELTVQRLESRGYSAEFYLGPFGALNAIRQIAPVLLILDVNMPGLTGAGIAELLRKTRGLAEMRVMLHSSMSQDELDELVADGVAHAALHKTPLAEEFLALVDKLMRTRPLTRRP